MLAGLDSRKFAALIRQILADIAAHAIGAPIARVLTQPKSLAEIQTDPLSAGREQINVPHTKDFVPRKKNRGPCGAAIFIPEKRKVYSAGLLAELVHRVVSAAGL